MTGTVKLMMNLKKTEMVLTMNYTIQAMVIVFIIKRIVIVIAKVLMTKMIIVSKSLKVKSNRFFTISHDFRLYI